jgi:alpha-L-rhamnosidase
VSHDSSHGRISSQWRQLPGRQGSKFTWAITIPPNTSATVHVPAAQAASVREGGRPAAESPGLKFLRVEPSFAVFEAVSGTYQFESEGHGTAARP